MLGCRSGGQCGHTPGGHPHLDPAGRGGHGGPDPLRCTLWVRAATSLADPESGIQCLETIFGKKILKFFDADLDPGSGFFLNRVPISGMENPDPG